MAEIGTNINKAKTLLEQGKLVSIPTETVYGLAANALDDDAVIQVFKVKDRPLFDPLIVHVSDWEVARLYVEDVPQEAIKLANAFWPGPLTLLLKKQSVIPDLTTAGLDTVAIRCPNHPLTLSLLRLLNFPLAAPSANPFGYVSPTQAHHVNEQLGNKIPYILDGGVCDVGIESTIVGFEKNKTTIMRLGGLSIEEIENVIGPVSVAPHSSSNPTVPGQLQTHYAPLKKVVIGNIDELYKQHPSAAVLSFQKNKQASHQFILSPSGNLEEAAKNLFFALRMLDKTPADMIIAEWVPEIGLGRAINDRLMRASAYNE